MNGLPHPVGSMSSSGSSFTMLSRMGTPNGDTAGDQGMMSQLHMSFMSSLEKDLSMEEAVGYIQDLMKENRELKTMLDQNNAWMKSKFQELTQTKKQWHVQFDELLDKHKEARKVVTALQQAIEERDATILQLKQGIVASQTTQEDSNKPGAPAGEQLSEPEHEAAEELQVVSDAPTSEIPQSTHDVVARGIESVSPTEDIDKMRQEIQQLHKITEQQKTDISGLKSSKEKLEEERVNLLKCVEEQKFEIKGNNEAMKKLQEINERLLVEKRDLVALNNQFSTQLRIYKSQSSSDASIGNNASPEEPTSDVLFHREYVIVGEEQKMQEKTESAAAGDCVEQELVAAGPADSGLEGEAPDHTVDSKQQTTATSAMLAQPQSPRRVDRKAKEDRTVSDLLVQLQEERTKVSELMVNTRAQDARCSELEKRVLDKEQDLVAVNAQLATMTKLKQEHQEKVEQLTRQIDTMSQELSQAKDQQPPSYVEDIQTLRAQVMSLVQEVREAEEKLGTAKLALDKYKQRCHKLEAEKNLCREEMETQRTKDDELIEALKRAIDANEATLKIEREEHSKTKLALKDMSVSFDQLCHDYHELLTQVEANRAQQVTQERDQQRIDSLMAQLIAAEEAMSRKNEEVKQLKQSLMENQYQLETIAVLKAQAEVYKSDFDAERKAREKQHEEKEVLLEELHQLQLVNQQLQDDVQALSTDQFAEMQRRHGSLAYQTPHYNVMHVPTHQANPGAQSLLRQAMQYRAQYPGPNSPSDTQYRDAGDFGREYHQETGEERETSTDGDIDPDFLKCPKCGIQCPDLDTLQIHAVECIDQDDYEVL